MQALQGGVVFLNTCSSFVGMTCWCSRLWPSLIWSHNISRHYFSKNKEDFPPFWLHPYRGEMASISADLHAQVPSLTHLLAVHRWRLSLLLGPVSNPLLLVAEEIHWLSNCFSVKYLLTLRSLHGQATTCIVPFLQYPSKTLIICRFHKQQNIVQTCDGQDGALGSPPFKSV